MEGVCGFFAQAALMTNRITECFILVYTAVMIHRTHRILQSKDTRTLQYILKPYLNVKRDIFHLAKCRENKWRPQQLQSNDQSAKLMGHTWHMDSCFDTAVKSNALAELMNRASKIHWKNLT